MCTICEAHSNKPGSKSLKKKVAFSTGNDMAKSFIAVTHQISALNSSVELLTKKSMRTILTLTWIVRMLSHLVRSTLVTPKPFPRSGDFV